jgi:hypothetical protein
MSSLGEQIAKGSSYISGQLYLYVSLHLICHNFFISSPQEVYFHTCLCNVIIIHVYLVIYTSHTSKNKIKKQLNVHTSHTNNNNNANKYPIMTTTYHLFLQCNLQIPADKIAKKAALQLPGITVYNSMIWLSIRITITNTSHLYLLTQIPNHVNTRSQYRMNLHQVLKFQSSPTLLGGWFQPRRHHLLYKSSSIPNNTILHNLPNIHLVPYTVLNISRAISLTCPIYVVLSSTLTSIHFQSVVKNTPSNHVMPWGQTQPYHPAPKRIFTMQSMHGGGHTIHATATDQTHSFCDEDLILVSSTSIDNTHEWRLLPPSLEMNKLIDATQSAIAIAWHPAE